MAMGSGWHLVLIGGDQLLPTADAELKTELLFPELADFKSR